MDRDTPDALMSSLQAVLLEAKSSPNELWLWLNHAYFVPGDFILSVLQEQSPELAAFLGLQTAAHGGEQAALLSTLIWLAGILLIKSGYNVIREVTASMSYRLRDFAAGLLLRLRILRRKLDAPLRSLRQRFLDSRSSYSEEFEIDDLQMAILRAHTRLPPGHVITAADVAEELGVRPLRAQQALDALRKLHLIEVSFSTSDGYPGYFLTRPGHLFLSSWERNAVAGH